MYISVLGPLSVCHETAETTPAAPKPRTVLTLLLLNHHVRMVPVPALIDELWNEAPPKTARAALQTYVFHLRKKIAETTGLPVAEVTDSILQTVPNGYRFVTEPGRFDLQIYRRLQHDGEKALDEGDLRAASGSFRRALQLWRGPVVADVEPGIRIRAEVAALEQSRMTMLESRIDLDLRFGLHREILSELATLTSRHRFHENLHATYMVALYRSGHRIRALEAYHQVRHDLMTEFGLEPSVMLKKHHQAVLTLDPVLDRPPERLPRTALPAIPAVASSF